MAVPKTFIDAIDQAFIDIFKDKNEIEVEALNAAKKNFSIGVAGYLSGKIAGKSAFNKSCREAIRSGADKTMVTRIQKMANGKIGEWVWGTYGDMVVYGTTPENASSLSTISIKDINLLLSYFPVDPKDTDLFKKYLPSWVTKERNV